MITRRIVFVRKVTLVLFAIFLVLAAYNLIMFFGPYSYFERRAHPKLGPEPPLKRNEQVAKKSFHDVDYEEAFIISADLEDGLVAVKTVDTRIRIIFRPSRISIKKFNKGWITPITFECGRKSGEKCDLLQPYKLYASNMLVEPVKVEEATH